MNRLKVVHVVQVGMFSGARLLVESISIDTSLPTRGFPSISIQDSLDQCQSIPILIKILGLIQNKMNANQFIRANGQIMGYHDMS